VSYKVLYFGPYRAIRLYIWSLKDGSCHRVSDVLPPAVERSLIKFGSDLRIARQKRGLRILALADGMGVSKSTDL